MIEAEEMFEALEPLLSKARAEGFELDEGHAQPSWVRLREGEEGTIGDKLVLWRHPRYPDELHGHVATSASVHALHLRFFDPDWRPERVLPGYLGKGFGFDDAAELGRVARRLTEVIWPRALLWFAHPVAADEVLNARGAILTLISPGPVLEQHRRRAAWLEARGQDQEAAYVRGIIAEVEGLFEGTNEDV